MEGGGTVRTILPLELQEQIKHHLHTQLFQSVLQQLQGQVLLTLPPGTENSPDSLYCFSWLGKRDGRWIRALDEDDEFEKDLGWSSLYDWGFWIVGQCRHQSCCNLLLPVSFHSSQGVRLRNSLHARCLGTIQCEQAIELIPVKLATPERLQT